MSEKLPFSHEPEEETLNERIIQFFTQYKRRFFYGILALLLVISLSYTLSSRKAEKKQLAQLEAKALGRELFQTRIGEAGQALEKLQNSLKENDALKPEYEGMLAQGLLAEGQSEQAKTLLQNSSLPTDFQKFASISLLLNEGKEEEALKESRELHSALQAKLSSKGRYHSALYLYNLLRLAFLQDTLKQHEPALWKELLSWIKSPQDSQGEDIKQAILLQFQEEHFSLADYCKEHIS